MGEPPYKKNKMDDSFRIKEYQSNLPYKTSKNSGLPTLNELITDKKLKSSQSQLSFDQSKPVSVSQLKLPPLNELLEKGKNVKLPPPDMVVLNAGKVPDEFDNLSSPDSIKNELPTSSKVNYSSLFLMPSVKLFSPNANIDLGVRKLCCILQQSANPESALDHILISDFMECICCTVPFNPDNMKRILQSLQNNSILSVLAVARICATYPTEMTALTDTVKIFFHDAISFFHDNEKEEFLEALLSCYCHLNLWSEICSYLDEMEKVNIAPGIKAKALEQGMNVNFPGRDCVSVCASFASNSVRNGHFTDMQGLALLWVRCIEENEGLWAKNIGLAVNKDKTFRNCVIEFLEQSIANWSAENIIEHAVELVKSWSFILPEIRTIYSKRFSEIELPDNSFQTLVTKLTDIQTCCEVDSFLVYVGVRFAQHLALAEDNWSGAFEIVSGIILERDLSFWTVDLGDGPIYSVLFIMEVLISNETYEPALEVMKARPMVTQNLHGLTLIEKRSSLLVKMMNGLLDSGDLKSARTVSELILDFISKDNQFVFNEFDCPNIWERYLSKYVDQLCEQTDYVDYTKCLDMILMIFNRLKEKQAELKLSRNVWSMIIKIGIDMQYEPRDSMLQILNLAISDEAYSKINVKDRFLFLPPCPERWEINVLLYAYCRSLKSYLLESLATKKDSINLLDLCHLTLVEEMNSSKEDEESKLDNNSFTERISNALNDLVYIENNVKFDKVNTSNVILNNIDLYNCVFNLE